MSNIFGSRNQRLLKSYGQIVRQTNKLESELKGLDDEMLRAKTQEFKDRLNAGYALDLLVPEAFAVVREASVRTLGMRHFLSLIHI